MLLTDGNPNSTEALRAYESAILSVANAEGIDLDVKLELATEEISQDVMDFLLSRASGTDPRMGVDPWAWATSRRRLGVSDVVVTRQMRRWHALHTLAVVYRDAFNNQLNDRYQAKAVEYQGLAAAARQLTYQYGLGLVYNPVPVAVGPEFSFATGTLEATTYFGRVSWVASDGAEGAASEATTYDAPAGSVPVVKAIAAPVNAIGYQVYLGLTEDTVTRQTSSPLAVGTSFTLPGTGLLNGVAAGDGQSPDVFVADTRLLRRG